MMFSQRENSYNQFCENITHFPILLYIVLKHGKWAYFWYFEQWSDLTYFVVCWLGLSRLCLQNAQKLLTEMLKSCYLNFRTWLTLVKKNSLKLGIKRVSCKYGRNLRIPKLIIIARNKSSNIAKSHDRTIMALGCKQYKLIRYQNL